MDQTDYPFLMKDRAEMYTLTFPPTFILKQPGYQSF